MVLASPLSRELTCGVELGKEADPARTMAVCPPANWQLTFGFHGEKIPLEFCRPTQMCRPHRLGHELPHAA